MHITWTWLAAVPIVAWAASWLVKGKLSFIGATLGAGILAIAAVAIVDAAVSH